MTTARPADGRLRSAIAWTTALRLLTRGVAIATTLVLARLISPDQYGIYTTIVIANQALQAITDLAVTDALTQRTGDVSAYLATVWTTTLVKGLVVFVAIFAIAPAFCAFFGVPEATDMLRVLGFVQVVFAFHSVGPTLLRRELRFGKNFVLYSSEAITFSLVAVGLAAIRHDAWSLVIATLASFAVRVVVSHVISPVRVGIGFDLERFRELFRFAKWVNANVAVDFVLETADNATVARLLGPSALAFYRMGYQIATEGSGALPWVLTTVAFPAFAKIQFERDHVALYFRALLGLVSAALAPLTVFLLSLSGVAVPLLLGDRWAPVAGPLAILGVGALARGVIETSRPVLLGIGASRADFFIRGSQAIALLLILPLAGSVLGMIGVAYAVVIAAVATLPLWGFILVTHAHLQPSDLIEPVVAPLVAALVSLAILVVLPGGRATWEDLLLRSALLVLVYGVLTLILLRVLPRSGLAATVRVTA